MDRSERKREKERNRKRVKENKKLIENDRKRWRQINIKVTLYSLIKRTRRSNGKHHIYR